MSLYNKYCSCGSSTCNSRSLSGSGCCNTIVQPAPQACCESHTTVCTAGMCFYVSCAITATTGRFFLQFKNHCPGMVPLNANEVFFYHASAGLMRIVGFDNLNYTVELVDESRAGAVITPDDCVTISVQSATGTATLNTRCLSGNFVAPDLNQDATIYILNGSGIPIGATLTFTANGETGSYVVKAFVSASGNVYAYTVTNTGSGHTPGTIIEGGCDGACLVPIEVITDVDICNLSTTQNLDTITGCLNGSPRAMVPIAEGYIPVGSSEGIWEQQKVATLDCCVILDGCLKFSGSSCPDNFDQVYLKDVNLECFESAWAAAVEQEQTLPMNINGTQVVVTGYDSGTRLADVVLASSETLPLPLEFGEGDQMCLGDCCSSCNIGPQLTNAFIITDPDFKNNAVFGINNVAFTIPTGTSYWAFGLDNTGTGVAQEYVAADFLAGKLPDENTPLAIKQKICNTSPYGCNQQCNMYIAWEFYINNLPADVTVHWEVGHYARGSATLEDGVTPNPFTNISTQRATTGVFSGPSATDADMVNCDFGYGNEADAKVYPYVVEDLVDYIILQKCDCALSIVWLFCRIVNDSGGEVNATQQSAFRRYYEKFDRKLIPLDQNDPDNEWFAY